MRVLSEILRVEVTVDGSGEITDHSCDNLDEVKKKLFNHFSIYVYIFQLFNGAFQLLI